MNSLPKGWIYCALHQLVLSPTRDIVDGPFGSNLKASDYVTSGISIIRLQNIARNSFIDKNIKYITSFKANSLVRHNFVAGDILITKLGEPLGKAAIVPKEFPSGIIVADIVRMRVVPSLVDARYVCYAINSDIVSGLLAKETKGSTRARVNLTDIRELLIPLPPLLEQISIANKLDDVVENAVSNKRRLEVAVRQVEALRHSVLKRAAAGLLLRALKAGAGQDMWISTTIDQVGAVGTGSTPSRSRSEYFIESGGTPWVTSAATGNEYIEAANENVTDLAIKESRLKIYPVGTLIVAMYGEGKTRGQVSELCLEATINQACAAIVVDETKALPAFVKLVLQSNYMEMRDLAEGGNQPNLNLSKIKNFPIRLPPLAQQKEIVEAANQFLKVLKNTKERVIALGAVLDKILPSAILSAFRGKLVSNQSGQDAGSILDSINELRSNSLENTSDSLMSTEFRKIDKSSPLQGDSLKSVYQVLEEEKNILPTQELFSLCGHSSVASTQEVEVFFLELRNLLRESKISVQRRGNEDFFSLRESKNED